MITIEKPRKFSDGDFSYYSAKYIDERNHISQDIYFKTESKWQNYYSSSADAWVILALLPGIKSGQSIYVNAPVSPSLLFTLENSLIPMFSSLYGTQCVTNKIKVYSKIETYQVIEDKGFAVGCGCSLGVDSLSAIKRYSSESLDNRYRISHLTLFNIGAFGGDDLAQASMAYERTLRYVYEYASELGLPVVGVESNASLLFRDWEFEQTHTLRNLSAVFALRKLFGAYYYASSYTIERTKVCTNSMSYQDSLILPLLSTGELRLYVADADKNRVEKTKYIVNDQLTQKYLSVCFRDINTNGKVDASQIGGGKCNCSSCEKCLRTLITIDILGTNIEKYSDVFDITEFQRMKNWYVLKIIKERKMNPLYHDIFQLMINTKYVVHHDSFLWRLLEKYHSLFLWPVVKKADHIYRRLLGKSYYCAIDADI